MFLYVETNTAVHRLNPATKILSLSIFFLTLLTLNHPAYLLPFYLGTLFVATLSYSIRNLWRFRVFFLLMSFFTVVLWSIFFRRGSHPLLSLGWVDIQKEAFLYGTGMAIRIVTMISCGIIFLSTTRVEEIAHGLTLLGLPHTLGFALSLALRLVPVFVAGAKTTLEAQAARGARLDGKNLLQKLRRHTPFLLPILIQALKKTDLLAASLESKGFGRRKRGYYLTFQTRWIDYTLVGGLVLLFFACLYLRIKGIGVCITKT